LHVTLSDDALLRIFLEQNLEFGLMNSDLEAYETARLTEHNNKEEETKVNSWPELLEALKCSGTWFTDSNLWLVARVFRRRITFYLYTTRVSPSCRKEQVQFVDDHTLADLLPLVQRTAADAQVG
jgi:hypothetical protein